MAGLPALLLGLGQATWDVYQGSKQREAYNEAAAAARTISEEQLNLLSQQQSLESEMIESKYQTGTENISFGANKALRDIQAFGKKQQKGDLILGDVAKKTGQIEKGVLKGWRDQLQQLLDTRGLEKKKQAIGEQQRKIEIARQEASITGSMPTGPTEAESWFGGLIRAGSLFV